MTLIEMGEEISKQIAESVDSELISSVIYGADIHGEQGEGKDCNLVLVFQKVDMGVISSVSDIISSKKMDCIKAPLIVQYDEMEGMADSVPPSFLDILCSYQTVYGRSIFKGLSSISHEHLRAQTEQRIREHLLTARKSLSRGIASKESMIKELGYIKSLLKRSISLYLILKKPWLTTEKEKWESFMDEFGGSDIWMRSNFDQDHDASSMQELRNLAFSIVDSGIKPLLQKVDEMGP